MPPGPYDLKLYRGDTETRTFHLWADDAQTVPVDLTGAVLECEIRDKPSGATVVPVTVVAPAPATGTIDLTVSAAQWADLTALKAGAWDLQVTYPGDVVKTYLAGKVIVTDDVTESTP